MQVECLNCGHKQEAKEINQDDLGKYTNCKKCESSFDIN